MQFYIMCLGLLFQCNDVNCEVALGGFHDVSSQAVICPVPSRRVAVLMRNLFFSIEEKLFMMRLLRAEVATLMLFLRRTPLKILTCLRSLGGNTAHSNRGHLVRCSI